MRLTTDEKLLRKSGILGGRPDASNLTFSKGFRDYIVLYIDKYIGDLNNKTASALRVLERFKEIKQEIAVDQSSFEDCIKVWKDKGKVPNLGLEINIYGPVSMKGIVGKALSDARVYLQSPLSMADGVELDNPHLIKFPNLSINSETRPKLRPTLSLTAVEISKPFEPDVCEVLEGLDQHESLNLAHADSCVISTLLEYDCIQRWRNLILTPCRHQLRGLHFLSQRESSVPQIPSFSFWEPAGNGGFGEL